MPTPPEGEDRYRRKYLDLLEEVDAKEKEWGELDRRIRRILAHLLIIARGPGSSELTDELARIKDTLNQGLDLPSVEARVEALKDRVVHESRWAEPSPELPPVHQVLIHLIERLPLPREMAERSTALVERLEGGVSPDALPEAIDAVTALVVEVRSRVEDEKREVETLLREVTGRLQEFDQGLSAAHDAAESGFAASRNLEAAVQEEVRGLQSSAKKVTDLDSLRRAVSATLESITKHLDAKHHDDEARQNELLGEVGRLRESVTRLEEEVASQQEKIRTAREASLHDPLTGCFNRLAFRERSALEEARWQRYGSPLSVLLLDVDRFKAINDTFGHRAGDQVLKAIAQIAAAQIRQVDFFARFGGEEFVALLPETPLDAAQLVAEKVRRAVEGFRFHSRGNRIVITLSCGVAELRKGDTVDSALERADRALYVAKDAGRNKTVTEREVKG